jgi:PAS domain S-box-containing protein
MLASWVGRPSDELRGLPLTGALRLLDERTGQPLADPTAPVFETGIEQRGHMQVESPDSTRRYVRYRVQPVGQANGGRVLGALLVMTELPRELPREPSQAASADHSFRALVDHAPVGIFVHRNGVFVYVNASFLSSLGYERADELLGRPVMDTVHPDVRSSVLERMRRVMARGRGTPAEVLSLRRDGSLAYLEGTGFLLDFEGMPATVVVMQDITARRAMDAAVHENEARYRHLFSDSPIALWEADFSAVRTWFDAFAHSGKDVIEHLRAHPELAQHALEKTRVIEVNDAAMTLYRAERREQLTESLRLVFEPEDYRVFREGICFLWLGQGRTFVSESWTRTLRGERREIEVRLSLMPGSEPNWRRVVLSLFDTTAFKSAERDLRASLREKDVLLKEVHHRVKNNLQVISSLLSLQAMQLLDPDVRTRLLESQNRIQAIALVHEKLYRSEQLSHIAFGEYAETLVSDLAHVHSAPERSIKTVLRIDDVRLGVDAAIPCGLMLNELVSNAFKHAFTGAASGTIEVQLSRADRRLTLSVADDGVGLPPGLEPRRSATLGFDLVFTFAEQLEADVKIETGAGTRFVISFGEK